jgi:hypothetical protein
MSVNPSRISLSHLIVASHYRASISRSIVASKHRFPTIIGGEPTTKGGTITTRVQLSNKLFAYQQGANSQPPRQSQNSRWRRAISHSSARVRRASSPHTSSGRSTTGVYIRPRSAACKRTFPARKNHRDLTPDARRSHSTKNAIAMAESRCGSSGGTTYRAIRFRKKIFAIRVFAGDKSALAARGFRQASNRLDSPRRLMISATSPANG